MDASLEALFNLYVFPTGRRIFALQQVHKAAVGVAFDDLADHCDAAVKHDRATLVLERRYDGEPDKPGTNPAAARIEPLVDRTLTAIRDHAAAQAEGAPANDAIHADVAAFTKAAFPTGVFAVTSLGYVEKLAAVDHIVTLLQTKLTAAVATLGLTRLTTRLADLSGQFREALEAPPPSLITFGRVRAARAEGQGLLLEAVAIILGKHHKRTADGLADRLALLGPILTQNEAIGAYLRSRRQVDDVNPETGQDHGAGESKASGASGPVGPSAEAKSAAGATAATGAAGEGKAPGEAKAPAGAKGEPTG